MTARRSRRGRGPAAPRGFAAGLLAAGLLVAACGLLSPAGDAVAETRLVTPGDGALQGVLSTAAAGDVLRLAPGHYQGPLTIDRPISLVTEGDAVIEGDGSGSVVRVAAPGVVLRGLTLRGSGLQLSSEDSGIFVTRQGSGAVIENNSLEDNLIGVYLKGAENAVVRGNRIRGRKDLRMNERGNGIHIWNAPGSVIEDNEVDFGRDGIFVTTSHHNVFRGNRFRNLRFAVHYMYTNDSEISGNDSRGNHIGYALMFSHRLTVADNLSAGDREHGILMNYANASRLSGNRVLGDRLEPGSDWAATEKCVFIYNANKNRFTGNRFEGCEIGIHFTAGSERNEISDNSFANNRTQVKYVGTRHVEWSQAGRGNYWSDNSGFDMDGDGLADQPYRPNDLVDQVVWRHPTAKLLLNSPALQVLRWAQSAFPTLYPGGVTDSAPLMRPSAAAQPAAPQPGEG